MEFMTRIRRFGKGSAQGSVEFCVYHLIGSTFRQADWSNIHTFLIAKPNLTCSNRIYDLRSSGQLQLPPLEASAFH